MKPVLFALAALCACPNPASATPAPDDQSALAERYRVAMQSARWTGPLLASNAETLPEGHFYTEPYFFDVISGGEHNPGSSGFYQYGLAEGLTVGFQPNFAFGTRKPNRKPAVGDTKLLSQLRLTHFTPDHRIPTVALVFNATVPTGKHDRLRAGKAGHGSGSFAPEVGINVQHYALLKGDRLLRARINVLRSFPFRTDVAGRSVYGTDAGFRGHARPGAKTTLIGAVEYSLTREWVIGFDVEADLWGRTKVTGHDASGAVVRNASPKSWNVGFAPAIEYNWSDRSGVILGVWIIPKGHNTPSAVIPAVAYSRFW
jgi:Putative MetA-pathway of phenol degradation